jgi:hypothetical protein
VVIHAQKTNSLCLVHGFQGESPGSVTRD